MTFDERFDLFSISLDKFMTYYML